MKSIYTAGALVFVASVLGGCASSSPQRTSTPYVTPQAPYSTPYQSYSNYGAIESIQTMQADRSTSGTGAVVGGVVGGLLGNQIGGGSGKTAATVVGVVGGAVVGNTIEQNRNTQAPDTYQIRVRHENGNTTTVVQDSIHDLRIGTRVRIADGRVYRY
jgi:outer membrane lipoprotein SlyB